MGWLDQGVCHRGKVSPYRVRVWKTLFDAILSKYYSKRLVEPFCGGLAIALSFHPKYALLNDINPHLIHFYQGGGHGGRHGR